MAEMPRKPSTTTSKTTTTIIGQGKAVLLAEAGNLVIAPHNRRAVSPHANAVLTTRGPSEVFTSSPPVISPIAAGAAVVEQVRKQSEAEKVVATITAQAKDVRDESTALTAKIVAFEDWLNTLPGRVITYCWIDAAEGPGDDSAVVLRLRRQGKRWMIEHADGNMRDDQTGTFSPLIEADIETKIFAVNHFPKLLADIAKAQNSRIEQLKKCSSGFDEFAAALGIKAGGK